mgnify:CR=1 FL=1
MKRKRTAVQNLDTPATTTAELRSQLSTCTGKICAYREVGKDAESREWAAKLVECLLINDLVNMNVLRNL